ncbi:ABC transporter ATP-binding protein [Mariprofundus sp. KV]|uniref:ABC transporter ATP-binding protein n=1 Tax=Mariprofundus sp. KV TaxID=2608715 RepID=UPI0015A464B0|nr:ABC transporter ATP-binding protein [Mariprofundus sp. KV]
MHLDQRRALKAAVSAFYRFSPARISLLFMLMLAQRLTAGVGLLLLIPLLQLVGLDVGSGMTSEFSGIISRIFTAIGVELTLPSILLCYVLIVSLMAAMNYWQNVATVAVQQAYTCRLRHDLYDSLLHSRWQFFISRKMSDFMYSLLQQVSTLGQCANTILGLTGQLILVAVYVGLSLLLSWHMTLLAITCALALMALLLPLNRLVLRSGQMQLGGGKNLMQMFAEQLGSLKMIKSYGSESLYLARMDEESRMMEAQSVRMTRINGTTQLVTTIGGVISFSICFYFALAWFSVSLATLLLLLLIFSRLMPQLASIQSSYQRLLHQLPAFEDVQRLMQACDAAAETKPGADLQPPRLERQIRLEHICFRYERGNRQVIDNLTLDIAKNATVALTGPSGAGKSTLADLIAGLLVPDSGTIYCDDTPLSGEQRMAWRRGVAYITQEVFLFHDTIRANLEWVADGVPESEIWQALEMAAAADFVRALPDGLDTVIGDRGIRLSGGERQRLALARALFSKPQLLILDEATSALDHDNEQKIHQALLQLDGKLTILIIAHRETTIAHVKQRIVLSGGDVPAT